MKPWSTITTSMKPFGHWMCKSNQHANQFVSIFFNNCVHYCIFVLWHLKSFIHQLVLMYHVVTSFNYNVIIIAFNFNLKVAKTLPEPLVSKAPIDNHYWIEVPIANCHHLQAYCKAYLCVMNVMHNNLKVQKSHPSHIVYKVLYAFLHFTVCYQVCIIAY